MLFEEVLRERLGYDLIRDVQVLTPTHKGSLGTVELNIALQRVLQRKLHGVDVAPVEAGRRPALYPGDKVIQTRNDYELGVMNGAMGMVLETGAKGALALEFDGQRVDIEAGSEAANHIQLAYPYRRRDDTAFRLPEEGRQIPSLQPLAGRIRYQGLAYVDRRSLIAGHRAQPRGHPQPGRGPAVDADEAVGPDSYSPAAQLAGWSGTTGV
jgi:hypothetical protein